MVRHIKVVLQVSSLPLKGLTCTETPCAADTSADKKKLSIEVQVINAGSGIMPCAKGIQKVRCSCASLTEEGYTRLNSRLALREDNPIVTWDLRKFQSNRLSAIFRCIPRRDGACPQIPLSPHGGHPPMHEVCVLSSVGVEREKRSP